MDQVTTQKIMLFFLDSSFTSLHGSKASFLPNLFYLLYPFSLDDLHTYKLDAQFGSTKGVLIGLTVQGFLFMWAHSPPEKFSK